MNHNTTSKNPLKKLYNWVLHWAETPYAVPALVILAFSESSFFPVPPDVLLIALCMGAAQRWMVFAVMCSIASVFGGLAGYGIGYFFSNSVGEVLLQWIGLLTIHGATDLIPALSDLSEKLQSMAALRPYAGELGIALNTVLEKLVMHSDYTLTATDKALFLRCEAYTWYNGPWGPWAVGIAGFTPIPYKVFTITAGIFHMNLPAFTISSFIGRSMRFFMVAGLIGLTYKYYGDKISDFIDRYFNWLAIAFVLLLLGGFLVIKYI